MRERVTVWSSGWFQIHVGANLLHCKFAVKLLIGHLNLQNEVTCLDPKHVYFVTVVIGLTVTGCRKQCSAQWQKSTLFLPRKINLCWSNLRLTFLIFALGQSQTPQQCFFRKRSVPMHTSFLVWWKSIFSIALGAERPFSTSWYWAALHSSCWYQRSDNLARGK